jgi:DNA-binding response OmpR family regulator
MLTAKAAEADKISGLEVGADDYMIKPFSVKELTARVRAVLRRVERESVPTYSDSRLTVDFNDMRVVCDGQGVKLTRKEFTLLEYLIKNTGRVATRQQLLDNVWATVISAIRERSTFISAGCVRRWTSAVSA